jgi:hypothetical protein
VIDQVKSGMTEISWTSHETRRIDVRGEICFSAREYSPEGYSRLIGANGSEMLWLSRANLASVPNASCVRFPGKPGFHLVLDPRTDADIMPGDKGTRYVSSRIAAIGMMSLYFPRW